MTYGGARIEFDQVVHRSFEGHDVLETYTGDATEYVAGDRKPLYVSGNHLNLGNLVSVWESMAGATTMNRLTKKGSLKTGIAPKGSYFDVSGGLNIKE